MTGPRPALALRARAAAALLVAAVASGCVAAETAGPPPIAYAPRGQPSPAHALLEAAADLDGAPIGRLPDGGRGTVAVVFASWCGHCRDELPVLAELTARHRDVRVLGINYRGHEEYAQRGDAAAVRTFVDELAPWLRVVPADERLWAALGRPPLVPTLYVFDRAGGLARVFDRRRDPLPDLAALEASLPP